jgi:hypothetical protein
VDNATSDAASKGKGRPTAREIEKIARNVDGQLLLAELRSEWKALSSQKTLVSGSSTSTQPGGSSTSTPSTTVVAEPSASIIDNAGPSADNESSVTIVEPKATNTNRATVEGQAVAATNPTTDSDAIVDPRSTNAPNTTDVEGLGITTPVLPVVLSETTPPDAGQGNNEVGSPTPDAVGILEDATGWPAWLCAAVDYFKGISTSPEWIELVEKWVAFEAHLSFPSTVSHSSSVAS